MIINDDENHRHHYYDSHNCYNIIMTDIILSNHPLIHCYRWHLESSVNGTREVNASCADSRVQSAVRTMNPGCWDKCGAQADNATAFCPVSCLFDTILGNQSEGRDPLTKEQIVAPYLDAFKPFVEGGCPSPRGWP